MRRWSNKRCMYPGCRARGLTAVRGIGGRPVVDYCARHQAFRTEQAEREWVDPADLEPIEYSGLSTEEFPCLACGHPRWVAHSMGGVFWDGPCLVPGCTACDGREDHAPGYVPGRRRQEASR